MIVEREKLPMRREAESFSLRFAGVKEPFAITLARFDDGLLAEVFIDAGKRGQMFDDLARDIAVLISIALQHGAPVGTLAKALTRDAHGDAQGLAGAVLDAIARGER
jgi:hypothetical protein